MILFLLNEILQFLGMMALFILSVLGGLAPYMMIILIGKAIRGDKHEQDR